MSRHRHSSGTPAGRRPSRRAPVRSKAPRKPDVPATRRVSGATSGSGRAVPFSVPRAAEGATPTLDLSAPASAGLADVILEIVGAEHLTLRSTLAAWQREQDRILNRAWRRPGGLVRPANL